MIRPAVWALLAGLALVLARATGLALFAWTGYLMFVLLAIGFATARLGERGLATTRQLSVDRVHLGESVEVQVSVENRSHAPALWVIAAEALPAGLPVRGARGRVVSLAGKRSFHFTYALEGARRGYHAIGPTVVRTGDLFGLFQRQRVPGGPSHLTVFPKLVAIEQARLASRRPAGDVRVRQRTWEDPSQVVGVRPYEWGDSLRRIHWRATAHTGELQSKLFQVTSQLDTVLLLDLRRADYPTSPEDASEAAELAITTAASLAQHVLDRRQRVGLLALGRDAAGEEGIVRVRPDRDRAHLATILSVLGRLELGRTDDLVEALSREKEGFSWGTLVVAITPRLDRPVLAALLDLRTSGFAVKVVLVGRAPQVPQAEAGLVGLQAVRVRSEQDIRGLGI